VGFVVADALFGKPRWLTGLLAAGLTLSTAILAGSTPAAWGINSYGERLVWGAIAGVSVAVLVQSFNRSRQQRQSPIWALTTLLLLVPLIAMAISAYTADRIRNHEKKFGEHLSQYRLREARDVVAKLRILDPVRTINNMPLSMLADDLDQQLKSIHGEADQLRKQLADAAISKSADAVELRIQLAQCLAILGQREEAIREQDGLTEKNPQADHALSLLGTLWEHQERWEESLRYYAQAREVLSQQAASPEQQIELAQAWKGIAYSQRKQGNYREAEAAYEKVLEVAPTAAHHFLMAQFQDDAQQGAKAQLHAYKAAEINPRAYRAQADQLVNGMLGEQFGCWSIFRNRKP
jgi:tetratricopeptide (TPR) repeat protein